MISWGDIDEAIATVRAISSQHWQLRGMIDVATALAKTNPSLALELLRDAFQLATEQGKAVWTIYDMRDIALAQALAGGASEARASLERAIEAARSHREQSSRDTFLEIVATGFVAAGLTADGLALLTSMRGDWPRVRIAVAVGAAEAKLARKTEAATAYNLAARLAEEGQLAARPFLHAYIALSEASVGLAERVAISLDRMEISAAQLEGPSRATARATAAITRSQLSGGDVLATLAAIADVDLRDAALRSLVERQIEKGRLDVARSAALAVSAPMDRAFSLSRVVIAQAKAGELDNALATLDAIPATHYRRVDALAAIAAALPR
ncbi:MAG: hypothetical protein R3D27_11080 [Hyphomicrobiaceae bacterium]